MTVSGARQHLTSLTEHGLVEANETRPDGRRGRPSCRTPRPSSPTRCSRRRTARSPTSCSATSTTRTRRRRPALRPPPRRSHRKRPAPAGAERTLKARSRAGARSSTRTATSRPPSDRAAPLPHRRAQLRDRCRRRRTAGVHERARVHPDRPAEPIVGAQHMVAGDRHCAYDVRRRRGGGHEVHERWARRLPVRARGRRVGCPIRNTTGPAGRVAARRGARGQRWHRVDRQLDRRCCRRRYLASDDRHRRVRRPGRRGDVDGRRRIRLGQLTRDAERADLAQERRELAADPVSELSELTRIYEPWARPTACRRGGQAAHQPRCARRPRPRRAGDHRRGTCPSIAGGGFVGRRLHRRRPGPVARGAGKSVDTTNRRRRRRCSLGPRRTRRPARDSVAPRSALLSSASPCSAHWRWRSPRRSGRSSARRSADVILRQNWEVRNWSDMTSS